MKKGIKMISFNKMAATILATSIALSSPVTAYAKETNYISDTSTDNLELTEEQYNEYVVESGDSLSRISRRICSFFGEKETEIFWPVIAYINETSPLIFEGQVLKFPISYELLVSTLEELNENGWTNQYIETYNIYSEDTKEENSYNSSYKEGETTVSQIVRKIYRDYYGLNIDNNFINLYLKATGLSNMFSSGTVIKNNDELFMLTEFIPTPEYVYSFANSSQTQTDWNLTEEELTKETIEEYSNSKKR